MAERRTREEREILAQWKAAPKADRRFINTLFAVCEAAGGEELHYLGPPAAVEQALRGADRDTLFSLIAECLACLLNSSVLERVKQGRRSRRRSAGTNGKTGRAGGRSRAK